MTHSRTNILIFLAATAGLLISSSLGAVDVYKCQDSNGRTLFQETPCAKNEKQATVDTAITVAINEPIPVTRENLLGKWCFFENKFEQRSEPEAVTLELRSSGVYTWDDIHWQQQGEWSLSRDGLILSDFGTHKVLSLTASQLNLERVSIMKLRRGGC